MQIIIVKISKFFIMHLRTYEFTNIFKKNIFNLWCKRHLWCFFDCFVRLDFFAFLDCFAFGSQCGEGV